MTAEVSLPPTLPMPLAAAHEFERVDVAQTARFEHGDLRRRRLYRSAPTRADMAWQFTQGQFNLWHTWFETDLRAGADRFYVPLAQHGDDEAAGDYSLATAWREAFFLGPYEAEVIDPLGGAEGYAWRVTARLELYGADLAERPPLDCRGAGTVYATGQARPTAPAGAAEGSTLHTGRALPGAASSIAAAVGAAQAAGAGAQVGVRVTVSCAVGAAQAAGPAGSVS